VKAMWMILQHDKPDDFVCSTGVTHTVDYLCQYVFSKLGLNYKEYVILDPNYSRPEETHHLKGDCSKLKSELGWEPEYTFESLLDEMIKYYQSKTPLRLSDIHGWI
jgi:GDPmannose 4,6-dehydratase